MRCAEGGKIDTVLYSAACGALNSTANAGDGAAIRISPIRDMADAQDAGVLPALPARSRQSVSPIDHHTSSHKNLAKTIAAVSRCQDRLHDSAREPEACHERRSLALFAIRRAVRARRLRHGGAASRNRRLEHGAGPADRPPRPAADPRYSRRPW